MKQNYFLIYDQNDERWEQTAIGDSALTIGKAGCVLCSICSLISFVGYRISPSVLSRALFFNENGTLWWNSINLLNLPVKFAWLETKRLNSIPQRLRNAYRYGRELAIVRIKSPSGNFAWHWMAVMGVSKNSIQVVDSYTAEVLHISTSQITGAAFFKV